MKASKKIILWIIVGILTVVVLGTIPSLSCFTAIIIALLIAPIERWQNFLDKYINGKIKTIVIVILAILMFATFPGSDAPGDADAPRETTTSSTTESTGAPTADPTAAPTTNPTTVPTTEPVTEPATEPATEPPHTHSFCAATCTTPKTCSCGATEGEPTGHSWQDATCKTPKTCSDCGATTGSASAHSYSGGFCSVCGSNDPNYSSESEITYVLNIKTMKFHRLTCKKLPTDNRQDTTMSRDEIIGAGYEACGLCHP